MTYALMLTPHPNIRYRESLKALARAEVSALLSRLGMETEPYLWEAGGSVFLCFDAPAMDEAGWALLSTASGVCFFAERREGGLVPLDPEHIHTSLDRDLPALLKYKGKTNETFTEMLLNLAYWNSGFLGETQPLWVLDPMCGKGTGPLTALLRGWNAVGIEMDRKDLKELGDYFARYLEFHRVKHRRTQGSRTVPGEKPVMETEFTFAENAAALKQAPQVLRLYPADAALAAGLLKEKSMHLLLCDLPYGVQHGPGGESGRGGLLQLMRRILPAFFRVLKPGGAMALSFNTFTLGRKPLADCVEAAGFTLCAGGPYDNMEHWVEQAVNRDVIVARKP